MNMLLMVFLLLRPAFGWKTCRPVCDGDSCITVQQDRLDYEAAAEKCRLQNGELLTLQSDSDKQMFDVLSLDLLGDFWIGLRLPAGSCSDPSRPLRGYKPASGNMDWKFTPSFNDWTESDRVCSPHCVSLSNKKKWTEKLCSDAADGFFCKTKHKDACVAQRASKSVFFRGSETCQSAPCEHQCTDEEGGYSCSCVDGFVPDSHDPRRCKLFCAQKICPLTCEGETFCSCPDGFISNEKYCEDIDECEMDSCAQDCKNTFGGYVCSCREGFLLKDEVKCVKAKKNATLQVSTPAVQFVKPAAKNTTLKSSSAGGGAMAWIWVVLVVVVIVSVVVVRALVQHQRHRKENSAQAVSSIQTAA